MSSRCNWEIRLSFELKFWRNFKFYEFWDFCATNLMMNDEFVKIALMNSWEMNRCNFFALKMKIFWLNWLCWIYQKSLLFIFTNTCNRDLCIKQKRPCHETLILYHNQLIDDIGCSLSVEITFANPNLRFLSHFLVIIAYISWKSFWW